MPTPFKSLMSLGSREHALADTAASVGLAKFLHGNEMTDSTFRSVATKGASTLGMLAAFVAKVNVKSLPGAIEMATGFWNTVQGHMAKGSTIVAEAAGPMMQAASRSVQTLFAKPVGPDAGSLHGVQNLLAQSIAQQREFQLNMTASQAVNHMGMGGGEHIH